MIQIFPDDIHNQKLVENAHPKDWVNPEPAPRYNLVVIGAGTAGLVTAAGAAGLGAKVALIEKHLMGGDCLNVGCVPSKGLLRAARAYADVRDAEEFGVKVPAGTSVDFPKVMERMRRLRAQISPNDSVHRFKKLGVDVFLGKGKFVSGQAVEVGGKRLCFAKAVIATGARAVHPATSGLQEAGFLTNETVFSLTELPKRFVVIGAGPIGCEMAQAFARFGSQVWILEPSGHILSKEDQDAAAIVEKSFQKDGITIFRNCKVLSVQKRGSEKILEVAVGEKKQNLVCEEILVGVGRAPNVEGLNLETVGVEYDIRKGVRVNDQLRTTNPRIFAAGDICSAYKFTHSADFLARIVIQNTLFFGRKKASALTIPWCTYTDPEIAHVGLYEKEAQAQGIPVQTFVQELRDTDRAILDGEEEGFVKVHLQKGSDKILGATIVARHAGEMISELTLAMTSGLGISAIGQTIHPYPTQAEAIRRLGDAYNRTRLTPFVKRLFEKYLTWMQ